MPQRIAKEITELMTVPTVEVTEVREVEEGSINPLTGNPLERGMRYLVRFDTPVDGGAGTGSVYLTQDRAIELGLVDAVDPYPELE